MRLVDASVFVHAFIKPKRKLKDHEIEIKASAKEIVKSISDGEEVVGLTVVQLAEIANILESYLPLSEALQVVEFLLHAGNVKVFGVTRETCLKAFEIARERGVGLSDSIAFVVMTERGLEEIYSFDKDFDKLGVKRITSPTDKP